MSKLTVTAFLSLDGVVQSPGMPDEDRSGGFQHGGWLVPYADDDMGRLVLEWLDEYRLWTYPVILGSGKRLFATGAVPAALTLLDSKTTSKGVVVNTYRAAGQPTYGSFALDG
jgi:hypothetical protein